MTRKYDIAVKTGSYTDRDGKEKGRYENVGTVMQSANGPYIILKRTFNPAGVPNPENRDTLILSLFEPKQQGGQTDHGAAKANAYQPQAQGADDDIPF